MLFRILDRYIVKSYLLAWVVVFVSLLLMVILFDFVLSIDEFFKGFKQVDDQGNPQGPQEMSTVLLHILNYYGVHTTHYFSLLAGFIAVIAAGFVLARMSHSNELTAVLASGVSLHRVLLPVAVVGVVFNMLLVLDQEFLMPALRKELMLDRDDPEGRRGKEVFAFRDRNNGLLVASQLIPGDPAKNEPDRLGNFVVVERQADPSKADGALVPKAVAVMRAGLAEWLPDGDGTMGRWKLIDGIRILRYSGAGAAQTDVNVAGLLHGGEDAVAAGATVADMYPPDGSLTDMSPAALRRHQNARFLDFLSYKEIGDLSRQSQVSAPMRAELQTMQHLRITTPVTNTLLLLAAVPFFLTRERRNLIMASATAIAMVGGGMGLSFMAGQWAFEQKEPHWYLVGAWVPVAIYAPLAVLRVDGIRT